MMMSSQHTQFRDDAMRTAFIVGAVGLILVTALCIVVALCCVRQRRRGGRRPVHSSKYYIYLYIYIYRETLSCESIYHRPSVSGSFESRSIHVVSCLLVARMCCSVPFEYLVVVPHKKSIINIYTQNNMFAILRSKVSPALSRCQIRA